MTQKKFLAVFLLILLVGTLSAQSFVFQKNEEVNFRFRCFDSNGAFCNSAIGCQISIEDPDGRNVDDNRSMTQNPTFFNVTLHTSILGTYDSIIICNGANSTSSEFSYIVTADGNPSQNFPIQFFFIIIAIFFIMMSYFNDRLSLFRSVGGILAMIMGILTLFPGYSLIDNSTLTGLSVGTILIGTGFYFLIEQYFSRNVQADRYDQHHSKRSEEDDNKFKTEEFFDNTGEVNSGR